MDVLKTPVSILHETMAKSGITPLYEYLVCTDSKIFKCKVTCCGIESVGSGISKKDAKHDAARMMLLSLNRAEIVHSTSNVINEKESVDSSIENDSLHNFVQELQILCGELKLELPVYTDKEPSGPPHARIFHVQCTASSITVDGIGKSKKQAKQEAARIMIKNITDSLDSDALFKLKKRRNLKSTTNGTSKQSKLKENSTTKLEQLSTLLGKCYNDLSHENLFTLKKEFQNLLKLAKLDFDHMLLETKEPVSFMLILQLNTTPSILEMSLGRSREEAEVRTIGKVIEALKKFFKEATESVDK